MMGVSQFSNESLELIKANTEQSKQAVASLQTAVDDLRTLIDRIDGTIVKRVAPSDNVKLQFNGSSSSDQYTKVWEVGLNVVGTLRFKTVFKLGITNHFIYFKIYKNGVLYGSEEQFYDNNGAMYPIPYTKDIIVQDGDVLTFYLKCSDGSSYWIYASDMTIRYDELVSGVGQVYP